MATIGVHIGVRAVGPQFVHVGRISCGHCVVGAIGIVAVAI